MLDKSTKSIAIVGAGLAGLAIAWHLVSRHPPQTIEVTLYDCHGIGAGASGMAAGLLHPYAGKWSKLNWRGRESLMATLALIAIAEKALGEPVASARGLIRLPQDEGQRRSFQSCAATYNDTQLWDSHSLQNNLPGISASEGLYISSAYVVDCPRYLQGLWLACHKQGARLAIQPVHSVGELDADITIIATGATLLPELSHLPIRSLKGQILELAWPSDYPHPAYPLTKDIYLITHAATRRCLVGATYEKQFSTPLPDSQGPAILLPAACRLYPHLQGAPILAHKAGLRATAPNHLPFYQQLSPSLWIATGLGSKGLLYHALLGQEIACSCIPHPS